MAICKDAGQLLRGYPFWGAQLSLLLVLCGNGVRMWGALISLSAGFVLADVPTLSPRTP